MGLNCWILSSRDSPSTVINIIFTVKILKEVTLVKLESNQKKHELVSVFIPSHEPYHFENLCVHFLKLFTYSSFHFGNLNYLTELKLFAKYRNYQTFISCSMLIGNVKKKPTHHVWHEFASFHRWNPFWTNWWDGRPCCSLKKMKYIKVTSVCALSLKMSAFVSD